MDMIWNYNIFKKWNYCTWALHSCHYIFHQIYKINISTGRKYFGQIKNEHVYKYVESLLFGKYEYIDFLEF